MSASDQNISPNRWIPATSATPLFLTPFTIVVCNWIYFTVVTITSIFLTICALLSAWMRYQISTPDTLGYVSSMMVENPSISIRGISPKTWAAMSGLERTRLLKGTRLVLGDGQGGETNGKLTLASEVQALWRVGKRGCFFDSYLSFATLPAYCSLLLKLKKLLE
jgi:hypothetical protein